MTRPELHALVDIVMDARERMSNENFRLNILTDRIVFMRFDKYHILDYCIIDYNYPRFSDFTKAVQEYIKTLENGK